MECLELKEVYVADRYQKVPCGKCAFCLQAKRSQWMFRIHWEMFHQSNPGWFLTLTYSEKFVKRVADGRLSLRFKDVQLFLKKLRKAGYYAKYICVGEYGAQTKRPHYHMLLWTDCSVDRLQNFWSNRYGKSLGAVHVGRITMQSAMYTLKYIIQPKEKGGKNGIEKTRAQFSHGLGIGYLTNSVYEYHTFDYERPVFTSRIDGREVALPRYYRYKIFTKYQRRKEADRIYGVKCKEEVALWRSLVKKGIGRNWRGYAHGLRVDVAKGILKKTKVGLTI